MKFLIVSGNPKKDGLCAFMTESAYKGASEGGAQVEIIYPDSISRCRVCGTGWGSCRETHICQFGDDGFDELQEKVKAADLLCFITPVYWGEVSETLKAFMDRLRRCEFGQSGALSGKNTLIVVSPGGSGNGALTALEQLDRFCRHNGAIIYDYIISNRWNNDYKALSAYAAAKSMAEGRRNGDTIRKP